MASVSTLSSSVSVEGIGIHSGAPSRVTLLPALSGAGIVFRTANGIDIAAFPDNVVDTSRCTILGKDGATISTIEHLMSAFAGCSVMDAIIEVEGPELPIGDGSANLWVEAIQEIWPPQPPNNGGSFRTESETGSVSPVLPPLLGGWGGNTPVTVVGKNGSFIAAYPSEVLRVTVAAVYDHPLIGTQIARFDAATDEYAASVAPARTFGLIEEVEALRKAGLALGGSEENAVVVYPDRYSRPLRFDNELARHKLLDLLGDLALAGLPLPALDIVAVKPSHRLNVEFAKAVRAARGI